MWSQNCLLVFRQERCLSTPLIKSTATLAWHTQGTLKGIAFWPSSGGCQKDSYDTVVNRRMKPFHDNPPRFQRRRANGQDREMKGNRIPVPRPEPLEAEGHTRYCSMIDLLLVKTELEACIEHDVIGDCVVKAHKGEGRCCFGSMVRVTL